MKDPEIPESLVKKIMQTVEEQTRIKDQIELLIDNGCDAAAFQLMKVLFPQTRHGIVDGQHRLIARSHQTIVVEEK